MNKIISISKEKYLKEYNKEYYKKNKYKMKENRKIYYEKNKDKINEKGKLYKKKNKEYYRQYSRDYKKKTKDKVNARNMAERYIIISINQLCKDCNELATHRHHEDYNKPLEVIFLCTKCHRERHRQLNRLIERRLD